MAIHPAYIEVLRDSFLANFIATFSEDFAFFFIQYFPKYDHFASALWAILGSSAGFILSFIIFVALSLLFKRYLESGQNYIKMRSHANKFMPLIFIISLLPNFGILVPVFLGSLRVNFLKFIFLTILFRSIYYFSYLYIL